jgi:hypothetical protein
VESKSWWEVVGVGSSHWTALRRAEVGLGRIRAPKDMNEISISVVCQGNSSIPPPPRHRRWRNRLVVSFP